MVKIRIDNAQQRIQEYKDAITDLVAFRVSILLKSLSHLNGDVIDFIENDLPSFRPITEAIITIVGDNYSIPKKRIGYSTGIAGYLASGHHLANINLYGLIQLCQNLLANNNQQLSELLVCEAAELVNHSETILNNRGLNTDINVNVIKLAFDYKKYNNDISNHIKTYFRKIEFVKCCPYCNTKIANHNVNAVGEVVESYQLDHFYDKARFPLLSYCLFNLVPSDHTCNGTNKGEIEFTDEFHMNPYLSGYTDHIQFLPIGLNPNYEVDRLELKISAVQGSILYRRLNGNNLPSLEQGGLGNLNVFKIRSKHLNEKHRAKTILKSVDTNNSNRKHIKKYLEKLVGLDIKDSYKKWYEEELNVCFSKSDFNSKAYSKFGRDIHDHYYSLNKSILNRYILELINEP